ncbi:prolyl 3-hydroxylase 3-like isoform X2 [Dermacentor albipictus]|uniref:prolyl 3-hydroxylase 3-like isoform X2 n=1 Tax=Dermacentor albipictus TaxID=60249 RepID=UPI0038FC2F62
MTFGTTLHRLRTDVQASPSKLPGVRHHKWKTERNETMVTLPFVQLLAHGLLSWLKSGGPRPAPLFRQPEVVRLSARNHLGAEDNPCDMRGREDKFCLRERLALRDAAAGSRDAATLANHVTQCPAEFVGPGGTNGSAAGPFGDRADPARSPDLQTCPKDQLPHCDDYFVRTGTRVALDEVCLNGRGRVVIDGLLNQEECDLLLKLSDSAVVGYGYGAGPHSLTKNELFVGISALQLIDRLRLSLENATASRLLFLASHSTAHRRDMSHTIHSDTCDFADNATCNTPDHKKTLSWRDYSAAIYLNSDFHGGQTVFTKTPRTSIRAIVRPKCGRMVSFASETAHGVLPVFSGKRCALLVWMTHTRRKEEQERAGLDSVLRDIDGRARNVSERDDRWDLLWQMERD